MRCEIWEQNETGQLLKRICMTAKQSQARKGMEHGKDRLVKSMTGIEWEGVEAKECGYQRKA
jgi:hypothetical protein